MKIYYTHNDKPLTEKQLADIIYFRLLPDIIESYEHINFPMVHPVDQTVIFKDPDLDCYLLDSMIEYVENYNQNRIELGSIIIVDKKLLAAIEITEALPDSTDYVYGATTQFLGGIMTTFGLNEEQKIKLVTHELGHFYGLLHCDNDCIMQHYESGKQLDYVSLQLCSDCQQKIKELIY